jgi:hypothetical protein
MCSLDLSRAQCGVITLHCRPGTISHAVFATVPDQRCTASQALALHRIRDTHYLGGAGVLSPSCSILNSPKQPAITAE